MHDPTLNKTILLLVGALIVLVFPLFSEEKRTTQKPVRQLSSEEYALSCRTVLSEQGYDPSQCWDKNWRRQQFRKRY